MNFHVSYGNKIINSNIFLNPNEVQKTPNVIYIPNINKLYTLIMYDPDAINGTFIHWLVINIIGNNIQKGQTLLPYKGPSPPPKTGIHRYIFILFEQPNKLNINEINQNRNETIENIKKELRLNSIPVASQQFTSKYKGGTKKIKNKKNKLTRKKKNYKNHKNKLFK